MEKVTTENPHRFSRREVLRAGLTVAAAVGVSQLASSKSQGREKELVTPKVTSLPTIGHDVIFIPAPPQEPTPTTKENIVAEAKPVVAEANPLVVEEERNPQPAPKESSPEYNLLSPEAFAPYAAMGGQETEGEEILDYFPQSYNEAPDSLKGLWGRAIDAKLRDKPQTDGSLAIDVATLPEKISFDYLLVPEGTKFFDIQEQEERILPCGSDVVVLGKIEGEENFLAVYQEPVNSCYYFAKVSKDALGEQKDLAASKNLVVEGFFSSIDNLSGIGTEEERKRLYEVVAGDSLTTIAKHFGLPSWHSLYGRNITELGLNPSFIKQGQTLLVPDKYKEEEFIRYLTPQESYPLSDLEVNKVPELYFPETGHSIKGPFLEFYQRWGPELLGEPISDETKDGGQQLFRNLVLVYSTCEPNVYLPCPEGGNLQKQVLAYPAGLLLYNYLQSNAEKVELPKRGEFEIGEIFQDFYSRNGGEQFLGFVISPLFKLLDGTEVQWTLNARLELKSGRVQLGPLGKEYGRLFPWFEPTPEQVETQEARQNALRVVEEAGLKEKLELEARTVGLLVYAKDFKEPPAYLTRDQRKPILQAFMSNQRILTEVGREVRDFLIFDFLAPGEELNFANVATILAWHEARFEMNPVVEKALNRLSEGSRLINGLIREKVIVEVFKDNKYPSLPEDWHGKFVFAGGDNPDLSGGLGFKGAPLLYGAYDQYRGEGSNDEQKVLEALVQNGLHEGIHSFIQPASNIPPSQGRSTETSQDPNFVPADARKGLLAHMSMCILTSAAQKHYGFEEKRDPRIDYILNVLEQADVKVLEQAGVDDPEAEVIQAASTFNGHRLWNIYEQVRKENDLSMDSLMSTLEPDLAIMSS